MTSVVVDGVEVVSGGHSTIWAGSVWSFYLAVVIVAKVSLGAIYDRWGLRMGTLLGTVTSVAAGIALCFPATDAGPSSRACSLARHVHGHGGARR